MDLSLLRHQSDSRFCFSIDERHTLIRVAISKLINVDKVSLVYGDPRTFHNNHHYISMYLMHQDQAFNYYEVVVETYPMRLMYVFNIIENGKDYYYAESGISNQYIFDLAFISAFQFIGENKADHVKENAEWKGRIIYQIFPERFAKSDKLDKSYVNSSWYNKDLRNNRNAFLGGDLYGIIEKLPYIKSLGIGAIYLTPIHPASTNHKYDVENYLDVDPIFGGKEAFKELITKAHELDIKIMMDLVFNHMSAKNPIFLDVVQKGHSSEYYDWFFINGEYPSNSPLNYLCFGNFGYMPKINTNNYEVQKYLISVAKYWLTNFGVDGFRLDVSEGVSHDFWMRFKIALKDLNPSILIIGENWFNSESYLGNNQFDGVMNYPFLGAVSSYICKVNNAKEAALSLDGLLMRYKDGHNKMMMNVLASHDIQRISNLTNNDKDLALIAYAMMIFYPGYPLIYYGEEIFMRGGGDPDNRRGMDWESNNFQSKEHELFKALLKLRKESRFNDADIIIYEHNGLLALKRKYQKDGYVLYMNMTDSSIYMTGNIIISNKYNINKEIEPHGFVVTRFFD